MDIAFEIFSHLFSIYGLGILIIGVSVGILGGALPGVSTTMTIALVAYITIGMDPLWGITFLAATQVGSTYGGSIAATVLNIPGTPAAAATAIEGYAMAKRGEAGLALSTNAVSSFVGNTIGVIMLVAIMPVVTKIAMLFGPWEMFWFGMFGVTICANLSRANFTKGLISSVIGLLLATVGMDPLWGTPRFSFGITYLVGGISLIPAMVGLFGMSEVFSQLNIKNVEALQVKTRALFQFHTWYKYKWMSIRASVLGFLIGVVPGVGANIASFVGYDHAYSSSKEKEKFGTGTVEGLVGTESANNACAPGAYAPLLALGVPGDGATAVILGILLIHGIRPSPAFLAANPEWIWQIAVAMFMAGVLFLFIGTVVGRGLIKLLTVPLPCIMATVVMLCVIGAYGVSFRIQDVYLMFIFGIVGLFMKNHGFAIAPMVLGIVLGGTIADANFRRGIMASDSFATFFTRPVSMVMVIMLLLILSKDYLLPPVKDYIKRNRAKA